MWPKERARPSGIHYDDQDEVVVVTQGEVVVELRDGDVHVRTGEIVNAEGGKPERSADGGEPPG